MTQKSQNDKFIKTVVNKSKSAWHTINLSKYTLSKETLVKVKNGSEYITNPLDIVTNFNNYFVDQTNCNGTDINTDITRYVSVTSILNSVLNSASPHQIERTINYLTNILSVGTDGMTTKVLKYTAMSISICHIMNLSFSTGTYTVKLKTGIVREYQKLLSDSSTTCYSQND